MYEIIRYGTASEKKGVYRKGYLVLKFALENTVKVIMLARINTGSKNCLFPGIKVRDFA